MAYKGNIGILRESIYVRDKLPDKKRKTKRKIRNISQFTKVGTAQRNIVISPVVELTVLDHLIRIRQLKNDERRLQGNQTAITEGFVYLVTSPLYDGWVKAGMTTDYEKRLVTYNMCDPLSRYNLDAVKWVSDRRLAETILLEQLEMIAKTRKGEWFNLDINLALKTFRT